MYRNNNSSYAMDVLNTASFIVGMMNYEQNLDQSKVQDMLDRALSELHGHLKKQDEKIDLILDKLSKGV